jgi:hypothetical protein
MFTQPRRLQLLTVMGFILALAHQAAAQCPAGSPTSVTFLVNPPIVAGTSTISPSDASMAVSLLFQILTASSSAPISVPLFQYGNNKMQIAAIGTSYVGYANTVAFSFAGSFADGAWHHIALTWRKTDSFAKYVS